MEWQKVLDKTSKWNAEGQFEDTLKLLGASAPERISGLSGQEDWRLAFRRQYIYTEALIGSSHISKAREAAAVLNELYEAGTERFGYAEDIYGCMEVITGIFALVQPDGDWREGLRKLGGILDRGHLPPNLAWRVQYYLAWADVQDYNLIDALCKLEGIGESGTPYEGRLVQELKRKIEALSELDFQALRREHRAFVEIGEEGSRIMNLCLNAEGTLLAVMYSDGVLKLLNPEDGAELALLAEARPLFREYTEYVSLAFSPCSRYLAVGHGIGEVSLYNVADKCLHKEYDCTGLDWEQLAPHAYYQEYTHIQFSPQGRYLVIVPTARHYDPQGDDGYGIPECFGTFYCLECGSGRVVLQHTYKDSKIAAIQVSPDEQLLAVGVFGGELAVWDLNSASRIARRDDFVWLGNPGWIGMTQTLAFSKDGRKLAYAALEHSIGIIHSTGGLEDERILLEQDRTCCALSMDSLGTVVFAEYNHYQPFYLSRWSSGQEIVQRLFTGTGMNVEEIVINEERDELWVNHSPRVEIRKYSTAELIKLYDPYLWKYSRFIRSNAVSISGQASLAAISHEEKIRLG